MAGSRRDDHLPDRQAGADRGHHSGDALAARAALACLLPPIAAVIAAIALGDLAGLAGAILGSGGAWWLLRNERSPEDAAAPAPGEPPAVRHRQPRSDPRGLRPELS